MSNSDAAGGNAPPESDEEMVMRLLCFYDVSSRAELIRAMENHIHKLQTKRQPQLGDDFPRVPREG